MCKWRCYCTVNGAFSATDLLKKCICVRLNLNTGKGDYLIDDYDSLSAVPIEVKSGKDYTIHSALNTFVKNEDYRVKKAYVLSNTREITTSGKVTYIPIYDVMFLGTAENTTS